MPSKNILKINIDNSYRHVYSRGINKQPVPKTAHQKEYFLSLVRRYLSKEELVNEKGRKYPNYAKSIDLLAYCIMDNHFHFLIRQEQANSMAKFMRSMLNSYAAFYNKQNSRRGPVFESTYKASYIENTEYLVHVSKYIHRNPLNFLGYTYSSASLYVEAAELDWLNTSVIMKSFDSTRDYLLYLGE